MNVIAKTPEPPYYAIIFTSLRTDIDEGYSSMAARMFELASQQPGFLGTETARADLGITISYWKDLDSVNAWKNNAEHIAAQTQGEINWYGKYHIRIARVEQDSLWQKT